PRGRPLGPAPLVRHDIGEVGKRTSRDERGRTLASGLFRFSVCSSPIHASPFLLSTIPASEGSSMRYVSLQKWHVSAAPLSSRSIDSNSPRSIEETSDRARS